VIDSRTSLSSRLERFRSATRNLGGSQDQAPIEVGRALAERLATSIDGDVVTTAEGTYVRCEVPARSVPIDRDRLAALPGQPPADVPLICLDTETTGLATATGTVAWLIGLGWWESDRFRQVQLVLPDHAEERAMLTAIADLIPANGWLVSYNGRGFDWPLLVTRYRLARRPAPEHGGHVDLLPVVRRMFRHRMLNARLRTAEAELLGLHRIGDLDGWEIPSRYLQFLHGGPADLLVDVIRHNDQDVRSLARLLAHLEDQFGDPQRRAVAAAGDLAGLARAFAREQRLQEALGCLDAALAGPSIERPASPTFVVGRSVHESSPMDDPWWSPRRPADFGGRPPRSGVPGPPRSAAFDAPWSTDRIAMDRAHLLRRLGRFAEAADAWDALAAGTGRVAIIATIEVAKLLEHRLRDRPAAFRAVLRGFSLVERRRRIGRPEPGLERDLIRRHDRLQRLGMSASRRSIA
jgi:hypothetical protein